MAIIVEEEQSRGVSSGVVSILVWLLILGIIAVAVYYVFFAEPELITISSPEGFAATELTANADIDPQTVLGDPQFTNLHDYVTPIPPGSFGRSNPFLGFEPIVVPKASTPSPKTR
ncbi:MAG: hypothetical protein RL681_492 [Candidatus Parcubacteria bacterium]|jgi:hypothetical protein